MQIIEDFKDWMKTNWKSANKGSQNFYANNAEEFLKKLIEKKSVDELGINHYEKADVLKLYNRVIKTTFKGMMAFTIFLESNKNDIILVKHNIYKLSHGIFLKQFSSKQLKEKFDSLEWGVMYKDTGNSQAENFRNANYGDFVYITYGGDELGILARITSDVKEVPSEIIGNSDWIYRQLKLIQTPIENKVKGLKSKKEGWLPSGNTTFFKIPENSYTSFEDLILKPYYGVGIISDKSSVTDYLEGDLTKRFDILPTNLILYGPPGTGKTYRTKELAISLIDPEFIKDANRREIVEEYNRLVEESQIVFTTFHQSLSYEDFIEGIKPLEPKVEDGNVIYKVERGIFNQIVKIAKENYELSSLNDNRINPSLNTIPFEKVFEELKIRVNDASLLNEFIDEPNNKKKGLVIELESSFFSIVSINGSSIRMMTRTGNEQNTMTKDTLQKIYESPDELEKIITGGMRTYYRALVDEMMDWEDDIQERVQDIELKNYVIIIDEINRGNVSQIFGELITLIEADKRMGNKEALTVKLPYSKDSFCVPPNLHIIGTMNTADRSVEALDTALRRRFTFEEVIPNPELISPSSMYCRLLWEYENIDWNDGEFKEKEDNLFKLIGASEELKNERKQIWNKMKKDNNPNDLSYFNDFEYKGISLNKILNKINERIEVLIDREHTIGHSYFIKVEDENGLKNTFRDNIIPLLQEYFYGDYGKIGLVLGNGFVSKIKKDNSLFPLFDYDGKENLNKEKYVLKNIDDNFSIVDAFKHLMNEKVEDYKLLSEIE